MTVKTYEVCRQQVQLHVMESLLAMMIVQTLWLKLSCTDWCQYCCYHSDIMFLQKLKLSPYYQCILVISCISFHFFFSFCIHRMSKWLGYLPVCCEFSLLNVVSWSYLLGSLLYKPVVDVARDAQCCIHTRDSSCRGQTHRWTDGRTDTVRQ